MSNVMSDGTIPARCRGVVEDLQSLGLNPTVSQGGKLISAATSGLTDSLVMDTVGQPRGFVRIEFGYDDQRVWKVYVIMS